MSSHTHHNALRPGQRVFVPRFLKSGEIITVIRSGIIEEARVRLDDGRQFLLREDEFLLLHSGEAGGRGDVA